MKKADEAAFSHVDQGAGQVASDEGPRILKKVNMFDEFR